MTQSPLERAAWAVRETAYIDRDGCIEDTREIARAVLTAIRGPSEAMVRAGGFYAADTPAIAEEGNVAAVEAWQAMIDAALEEW